MKIWTICGIQAFKSRRSDHFWAFASHSKKGCRVGKSENKNENFSRPAAQGGLHRDSQGFTWIIPEGLIHWVSLISEFCTIYEKQKSSNQKAFLAKKFRVSLKVNPWKFRQDQTTFRGFLKIVLEKNNNNNKNNAYHSKTCRQSRR